MGQPDAGPDDASSGGVWAGGFILMFLGFQIVMPLSYYFGDDSWDERFAWRMFSTVRMANCDSSARAFSEAGSEPIRIWHDVQVAWRNVIERNRDRVVRAFIRRRCRDGQGQRVEVQTHCVKPGGDRSRHTWSMDCASETIDHQVEALGR